MLCQGIVPTLIIVRVGLGISTQDVGTYAAMAGSTLPTPGQRSVRLPMQFARGPDVESSNFELEVRDQSSKNEGIISLNDEYK